MNEVKHLIQEALHKNQRDIDGFDKTTQWWLSILK